MEAVFGFLFDSGANALWTRAAAALLLRPLEKVAGAAIHLKYQKKSSVTSDLLVSIGQALDKPNLIFRDLRQYEKMLLARLSLDKLTPQTAPGFTLAQRVARMRYEIGLQLERMDRAGGEQNAAVTRASYYSLFVRRSSALRSGTAGTQEAVAYEQLLREARNAIIAYGGGAIKTVGPTLLAQAYDWASQHRRAVRQEYRTLEYELLTRGAAGETDSVALIMACMNLESGADLVAARREVWDLSESLLWAMLLQSNLRDAEAYAPEGGASQIASSLRLDPFARSGIDGRLSNYLVERFGQQAEQKPSPQLFIPDHCTLCIPATRCSVQKIKKPA